MIDVPLLTRIVVRKGHARQHGPILKGLRAKNCGSCASISRKDYRPNSKRVAHRDYLDRRRYRGNGTRSLMLYASCTDELHCFRVHETFRKRDTRRHSDI